ncbi:alpha/beta hydrolase family protein [Consotaella salsifontis]|uniref:Chlorophyllase enzyme n=1 Tax=Consotaella salsifontis TaxID=1365950 RepID=A0A1T4T391_9HYPH|nr:alpha/beta fold hydrolase [Consotaella salsifontis]SKA34628.1 Chlorophyllase enzyme [Consotaella salsifontis]
MLEKPTFREANMDAAVPVVSVRSLRLPSPGRGEDLQLRLSAPVTGVDLPLVLFSHGFGSSMDGYAPLVDYWAAHGFVIVQPTYLDSRRLGLAPDDARRPSLWRTRVQDAKRILDNLDRIEQSVPGLAGRVDRTNIAAAGHSFGGQTTSMLLGARMVTDGADEDMSDRRVKAGILLASGGKGGDALSEIGRTMTPYLNTSFDHMVTPALIVAGDADHSPLTERGPDWFYEPYFLAPGRKALLVAFGGEHMLGGISGYEVTETTDENPDRVALIQQVTLAYLRQQLLGDETAWSSASATLANAIAPHGRLQTKSG